MLSPFTRALVYYLGAGFALALFCAIWYLDQPSDTDAGWAARVRRRILMLTPLGLAHPVIALAAVGLALDLSRADPHVSRRLLPMAVTSLTASLTAAAVVLAVTA